MQFALVWIGASAELELVDKFCYLDDMLNVDGYADAVGECFFWCPVTQVVRDKRPLNGCVCVCVCVCLCVPFLSQPSQFVLAWDRHPIMLDCIPGGLMARYNIAGYHPVGAPDAYVNRRWGNPA